LMGIYGLFKTLLAPYLLETDDPRLRPRELMDWMLPIAFILFGTAFAILKKRQ
jgi:hypothetical protein